MKLPMHLLPRNARFISPGPAGTERIVFTPAPEGSHRVVTDQGFFDFTCVVDVEVTYLPEDAR